MAKQIVQRITDDLDGSEGATSVQFGLDGHLYTIDLSEANEAELRARLAPFVEHAARGIGRRGRDVARRLGRRPTDYERNQALRAWALENGVELATRGRIANAVAQAFDANDVDALYVAAGLERAEPAAEPPAAEAPVAETSRRRRKPEALFSSPE
jgi:Lsr2